MSRFSRPMKVNPGAAAGSAALLLGLNDGGDDKAKLNTDYTFFGKNPDIWTSGFAINSTLDSELADPWFYYTVMSEATHPYTNYLAVSAAPVNDSTDTMDDAADGVYNDRYKLMATNLIDYAPTGLKAPILIRPAWEWNGGWQPWTPDNATQFIQAFRNMVTQFRAGATARSKPSDYFKFAWNCAAYAGGLTSTQVEDYYPGDDCVDFIDLDLYVAPDQFPDSNYTAYGTNAAKAAAMFEDIKSGTYFGGLGLNWLSTFATAKNKPMGLWEWGIGAGDATSADTFISKYASTLLPLFASWFSSHNFAYEMFWDSDEGFCSDFTHGSSADRIAMGVVYKANFPCVAAGKF